MLIFAVSRWPGMLPQNFSAAHALLFCAAFWLPGWMGWVLPLATIIVTDILLNVFAYDVTVLDPRLVTNWMILALFVVLAKWLARRRSYGRVFLGTLFGALLFYLVSNSASTPRSHVRTTTTCTSSESRSATAVASSSASFTSHTDAPKLVARDAICTPIGTPNTRSKCRE